MSERAVGRPWTAREDELLANAVAAHGHVDNWKTVAESVPGRTNKACRKRWLHSLSPSVKKTAWSKEEDDLLLELFRIHSAKWSVIARNIPGRTDDACSKRYREALDPSLKKDEWTPAEDDLLLAAYARLGGKWGRVGHELQRSGLACRNRWRLLQRKRASASHGPPLDYSWNMVDLEPFWPSSSSSSSSSVPDPQPLVHQFVPFHYPSSSSSLSSALSTFENDPGPSAPHPLLLPSSPSNNAFVPFDYDSSSTCTLSVGSTSPAPQSYIDDMHHSNIYTDCPHQFHQLQRSATAIPVHSSSAHPVHVDHYTPSVPHEECSLPLASRHQSSSRQAPSPAEAYFPPSLPDQQANHMSSSMTSVSLLTEPDPYYRASPEPQLDVNPQHPLLPTPDPLSLSDHYAHQRDPPRARVVETLHGQEQHGEYRHSHVLPDQTRCAHQPSRPPTISPPYALERRNANTPILPDPGPSSEHYYSSSQLVQRSTATPRALEMPYTKRPSSDVPDEHRPSSSHPAPRQKIGPTVPRKRSDTQIPLRLSSDLRATPDSSIRPYSCGHESCWPPNAAASRSSYCTSRGLSDHNKAAHPDDSGGDRPYRCGLEGCGKSWKSINGLQYHLQISKAHFQHAITSTFVSSYIGGLSIPESVEASVAGEGDDKTKKLYKCPHESCPNRYKQLSGLRYHLAHGHPVELPKQLDLVPPALSRKLTEKMRVQPSTQSRHGPEASSYAAPGIFNS